MPQRFYIWREHDMRKVKKEYITRAEATRALAEHTIDSTYTAKYTIRDETGAIYCRISTE